MVSGGSEAHRNRGEGGTPVSVCGVEGSQGCLGGGHLLVCGGSHAGQWVCGTPTHNGRWGERGLHWSVGGSQAGQCV